MFKLAAKEAIRAVNQVDRAIGRVRLPERK